MSDPSYTTGLTVDRIPDVVTTSLRNRILTGGTSDDH
jgi:hypothetical protein